MNLKNEQRINFLTKEVRSEPPSFIYYDDFAKNLGTLQFSNSTTKLIELIKTINPSRSQPDGLSYVDIAIKYDVPKYSSYIMESLITQGCLPTTIESFNFLKENHLLNYYSNDNYQKILIAVSLGGNNLLYQDIDQNNETQLILGG